MQIEFWRRPVVLKRIGDPSKSWLYDQIKRGLFPAPIKLSARSSVWNSEQVLAWMAERVEISTSSPTMARSSRSVHV